MLHQQPQRKVCNLQLGLPGGRLSKQQHCPSSFQAHVDKDPCTEQPLGKGGCFIKNKRHRVWNATLCFTWSKETKHPEYDLASLRVQLTSFKQELFFFNNNLRGIWTNLVIFILPNRRLKDVLKTSLKNLVKIALSSRISFCSKTGCGSFNRKVSTWLILCHSECPLESWLMRERVVTSSPGERKRGAAEVLAILSSGAGKVQEAAEEAPGRGKWVRLAPLSSKEGGQNIRLAQCPEWSSAV